MRDLAGPAQRLKPYPLYETREVRSVKDLFNYPLAHTPDKDVFRYREGPKAMGSISWQQFRNDVDDLGTALYSRGLKGKHIAVIGDNMYEWILTYMTAMCGDMVIVPLDKDLPAEQLAGLIRFADVSAIVFAPRFAPMMDALRTELPNVSMYVSMRPATGYETLRDLISDGARLRRGGDTAFTSEEPDISRMSALLFTSGTTGRPKGVMLSQENIVSCFDGACKNLSFTEDDVMLSVLPLHHAYESVCGILAMLHTSTVVCFNENLKLMTSNLQLFSPTGLSAVPLVLDTLVRQIRDGARKTGKGRKLETGMKLGRFLGKLKVDASEKMFSEVYAGVGGRLRKGFVGGAPLNLETLKALDGLGIQFRQGYGITECSPLVSVNRDRYNKPESVGIVLDGLQVRIQDGEIQVKGPSVMLGYYKEPDATREAFSSDGWFRTGDLGYIDDDGFLYVTGRKKNLIILSSGENISPEELEQLLNRDPMVHESVVAEDNGQIVAHIYAEPDIVEQRGQEATLEALNKMVSKLNSKQPRYRHISRVVLHSKEFEKSTTKKILRHKLQE